MLKNLFVNLVVGLFMVGLWSFTYALVLAGKASRYTNAKLNGKKLAYFDFVQMFGVEQRATLVETDQGKIAAVHGVYSDGRIGGQYLVSGQIVDENEMAANFDEGEYILISCVNAEHRDFSVDGKTFVRDKNTCTNNMTALVPTLWGDFMTWAGPGVDRYYGWLTKLTAWLTAL